MTDDPNFYHPGTNPPRMSVSGFTFDPATGIFDFSAVPGFDLARLESLWHVKLRQYLYARPYDRPLDLAEVDGVPVSGPPATGSILKVTPDTSTMSANDEIMAFYDLTNSA